MSILDDVSNFLTGGVGKIVSDVVGSFLPAKKMTEQEQLELQNKIMEATRQMDLTELNARFADTANARAREIAFATAGKRDWTVAVLAYLAVLAFFACVMYILIHGLSNLDGQQGLLIGTLLGGLLSNSQTVYNYYFGSSSGSKQKQEMLKQAQDK